ncbi:MAG: MCE family protein [Proteobacteria bacterium]|nr:MCE family protein [Pseudomonadota bacterium]
MSGQAGTPAAEHHSSRWPGWIWSVPIAAIGIAIWLAIRSFASSGPEITVVFPEVADLKAGDTMVKFQDLVVGQVETVKLEKDLRHIRVKLNMHADMAGHLGKGTRFWIAGGSPSLSNLASIRSIISGPSIAIQPAPGAKQSVYQGLAQKPVLSFGEEGTAYILHTHKLGSIQRGTPIYYLGQEVGTVKDTSMVKGQSFSITAFVDRPYDQFVHAGTRFWSAGAVSLDTGGTGPQVQFQSIPSLIEGAVDFATPKDAAQQPPAKASDSFTLFGDRDAALYAPGPNAVLYRVRFPEASGGLAADAAVTLEGTRIGSVVRSRLLYDPTTGAAGIDAVIGIDPAWISLAGGARWTQPRAQMNAMLDTLLSQGVRASLVSAPPVIGGETVALRLAHDKPAKLGGGPVPEIPTSGGGGIAGIMAKANDIVSKFNDMPLPQIASSVDRTTTRLAVLTSSPELGDTLQHVDHTSLHLDRMTADMEYRIPAMLTQLRQALEQTTAALRSADAILSSGSSSLSSPEAAGLPGTLYEVTRAARSLRELTDFLDRHPGALITGRGGRN